MNQQRPASIVTLKIIWGALLMSHFIYLGVFFVISKELRPFEADPMVNTMLMVLSVVMYGLGFFLPQMLLKQGKKESKPQSIDEMLAIYQTPCILRLAMYESSAIIGFVLGMLNRNINFFIPYICLNVVLYFLNFPSDDKIKDAVRG